MDERSILITGDINGDDPDTPALEVLVIVSGCHVVVGSCVHQVPELDADNNPVTDPDTGEVVTEDSAAQRCSDLAPSDAVPDTRQLADISMENVVIVAAGGLWAADLEPSAAPCPVADDLDTADADESSPGYQAPDLTIVGSVIAGNAGVTSRWRDCDNDPLTPTEFGADGREQQAAGFNRQGSLPPADQWATASPAWWPGRGEGVWRRR